MNILCLGSAACNIASFFEKYPQYKIFKINVDISGEGCYNIPILETAEEYEQYGYPELSSFLSDVAGPTTFVVAGSSKISCASLRILEHIRHLPIRILYVMPDLDFLDDTQRMQERLVRAVLQEYTRSGVFEEICLISNKLLDDIVGGAPVIGYYDKLNEALIPTVHMINVFMNTNPIFGKLE